MSSWSALFFFTFICRLNFLHLWCIFTLPYLRRVLHLKAVTVSRRAVWLSSPSCSEEPSSASSETRWENTVAPGGRLCYCRMSTVNMCSTHRNTCTHWLNRCWLTWGSRLTLGLVFSLVCCTWALGMRPRRFWVTRGSSSSLCCSWCSLLWCPQYSHVSQHCCFHYPACVQAPAH